MIQLLIPPLTSMDGALLPDRGLFCTDDICNWREARARVCVAVFRNERVKVARNSQVQSNLCTLQTSYVSTVIGNTFTRTVSTETPVENNTATRLSVLLREPSTTSLFTQLQGHTPSIAFRHLPPDGCRKPVLGIFSWAKKRRKEKKEKKKKERAIGGGLFTVGSLAVDRPELISRPVIPQAAPHSLAARRKAMLSTQS